MNRNVFAGLLICLLLVSGIFCVSCTQPEVIVQTTLFAVGNKWILESDDGSSMSIDLSNIYDINERNVYLFDIVIDSASVGTSLLLDWDKVNERIYFVGLKDSNSIKILPSSVQIAELGGTGSAEESQIDLWSIIPVGNSSVSTPDGDYQALEIEIAYPERTEMEGYKIFLSSSEGVVRIDYAGKTYLLSEQTILPEPNIPPVAEAWGQSNSISLVKDIYEIAEYGEGFSELSQMVNSAALEITEEEWLNFSNVVQNKSDIETPWIIWDGQSSYTIEITAVTTSGDDLGLNDLVNFSLEIQTSGTSDISRISLSSSSLVN